MVSSVPDGGANMPDLRDWKPDTISQLAARSSVAAPFDDPALFALDLLGNLNLLQTLSSKRLQRVSLCVWSNAKGRNHSFLSLGFLPRVDPSELIGIKPGRLCGGGGSHRIRA